MSFSRLSVIIPVLPFKAHVAVSHGATRPERQSSMCLKNFLGSILTRAPAAQAHKGPEKHQATPRSSNFCTY